MLGSISPVAQAWTLAQSCMSHIRQCGIISRHLLALPPVLALQLVINNAGVASWGSFEEVDTAEMLNCFITNTIGPILVSQQLFKLKLIGPPGSIVANMTSKV